MRLVDADKLYLKTGEIDAAPTVDAIPIEFIRRFVTFNPPSSYTSSMYGDEFFDENSWCDDLLDWWHRENK